MKKKSIKAWAIMETEKEIMCNIEQWEQFEIYRLRKAAWEAGKTDKDDALLKCVTITIEE